MFDSKIERLKTWFGNFLSRLMKTCPFLCFFVLTTSAAYSPVLGSAIAIGFLKKGSQRKGEHVRVINLLDNSNVKAEVVSAHFIDPEGEKLRG